MQLSVSRYASYSPEKHVTFCAHEQFAISYNIAFHIYVTFFFFRILGIFDVKYLKYFVWCPQIVLQKTPKYDFYKAEVENANTAVSQWLLW